MPVIKRLAIVAAVLTLLCAAAVRAEGPGGAYLSDYDEALRIIDEYDPFYIDNPERRSGL